MNSSLKYIMIMSVSLQLAACSVGGKDQVSGAFNESSVDTSTQKNIFDLFHPVRTSFSYNTQFECNQSASLAVGITIMCTFGGSCEGGGTYGACLLTPVPSSQRANAQSVSSLYSNSDVLFPKGRAAANYLRHLYLTAYNREPDIGGFYYWLNDYFNNNVTVSNRSFTYLADAIIRASECQAFANAQQAFTNTQQLSTTVAGAYVTLLYRTLLGREATVDEYIGLRDQLVAGLSPEQALSAFYNAPEAINFAKSFGL